MLGAYLIGQERNRAEVESNFGSDRIPVPSASRAFGPPVRSATLALQNRLNQDTRSNDRVNMSGLFKPFGLQTRQTALDSILEENTRIRQSTSVTSYRGTNNVSTLSRTFGLRNENVRSLNVQNNSRLNLDVRNSRSSFVPTSFGLQTGSFSTLRDIPSNDNSRFNQDLHISNYGNANEQFQTSNTTRLFGPAFRNTSLTNGLQIQETCNEEIDNGGFRVPSVPRLIKGRNPITSLRLFAHQSIDKCKNLSNINGFDVSHISRRDMNTMSESRLGLMRNGCMDKQSVSGSMYSTGSVKAQVMNLFENLHYSILNMGPYVSVNDITVEIEKAKQGLENLCEVSLAPSLREADGVSITSHTSKCNYPEINDPSKSVINGEYLNLKSSKDVLKSLTINNTEVKSRLHLNQMEKKSLLKKSVQNVEVDPVQEDNSLVFKKPKPYLNVKKSPHKLKIRTPPVKESLASKLTSTIITLKQWYPIAVGKDLALCGIDDQGNNTRTDAVKKRVNNRKVELINGLSCNLIGSPSSLEKQLPKSISTLLKNGLTSRWRVLQKQLLNCQTVVEKKQRKSKSPNSTQIPTNSFSKKTKSPKKDEKSKKSKSKRKSPRERTPLRSLRRNQKDVAKVLQDSASPKKSPLKKEKQAKTPKLRLGSVEKIVSEERISNKNLSGSKIKSSPMKRGKDVRTRSGRTVKPPTMFWIGKGNSETPSPALLVPQEALPETPVIKRTKSLKNSRRADSELIQKGSDESQVEECHVNSTVDVEKSAKKSKAVNSKKKPKESQKVQKEQGSKKETQEVVKVVSSTEEPIRKTRAKRKRDVNAETESVQRKKSKVESYEEFEVESTVKDTSGTPNKQKKTKTQVIKDSEKPKTKVKQVSKKKVDVSTKKTMQRSFENLTETKFIRETEEDFEFQLEDIEIPQFGNFSGNTQLSKSQLRLVSAETPPLKYFNSNLKILSSTTPMQSPDWVISQRTESEVKQFQKRRAEAFKKKVEVKKTESKKTVVTGKTQTRDLKKVLEWVAEKTVQSPQWSSKVLQYVLPSRRQLEQEEDEEEDEDGGEFV